MLEIVGQVEGFVLRQHRAQLVLFRGRTDEVTRLSLTDADIFIKRFGMVGAAFGGIVGYADVGTFLEASGGLFRYCVYTFFKKWGDCLGSQGIRIARSGIDRIGIFGSNGVFYCTLFCSVAHNEYLWWCERLDGLLFLSFLIL